MTEEEEGEVIGMINPPHIVSYEGSDINVSCTSDTSVQWAKKSSPNLSLSYDLQHGRHLTLKNVTMLDSGKYYCFGTYFNKNFTDSIDILIGGN